MTPSASRAVGPSESAFASLHGGLFNYARLPNQIKASCLKVLGLLPTLKERRLVAEATVGGLKDLPGLRARHLPGATVEELVGLSLCRLVEAVEERYPHPAPPTSRRSAMVDPARSQTPLR